MREISVKQLLSNKVENACSIYVELFIVEIRDWEQLIYYVNTPNNTLTIKTKSCDEKCLFLIWSQKVWCNLHYLFLVNHAIVQQTTCLYSL